MNKNNNFGKLNASSPLFSHSPVGNQQGLEDHSKSFGFYIEKALSKFNGMISRNGGRSLIGFLLEKVGDVGGKVSRFKVVGIATFCFHCYRIMSHEGSKGLVMNLKVSHVLIQQAVAGYIIEDLSPLKRRVNRDRAGIPKWIPNRFRFLIHKKDKEMIKFWTTLCALYRVIEFKGIVNMSSITDSGPILNNLTNKHREELSNVIDRAWSMFGLDSLRSRWYKSTMEPFPIGTSSPQTTPSVWSKEVDSKGNFTMLYSEVLSSTFWSIWSAARVWISKEKSALHEHLSIFLEDHPEKDRFLTNLWNVGVQEYTDSFKDNKRIMSDINYFNKYPQLYTLRSDKSVHTLLGKLGFKNEPAGKVRVFAMVDCWTQWLLKPLHSLIQDVLRRLDEDATFDQVGKLEKKIAYVKSHYNRPKAFSFDLSSATDRLPVLLQVYVLAPLLGLRQAIAWANLLITRDYGYKIKYSEESFWSGKVRYAVGQPMGALSSWVMLALTHHIIVQWAAYRVGGLKRFWWFKDYIVLGDDVVIFDPFVASQYQYIMDLLGVKIGLAKSICSSNSWTLEFAKKYYVDGEKANMVPFRDVIVSSLSTTTLNEFCKKHSYTFNSYLKLRGMGYKGRSKVTALLWNMPSRLRTYFVLEQSSQRDWLDWITMRSGTSNWRLTRTGVKKLILHLLKYRDKVLVPKLTRLEMQEYSNYMLYCRHPYFLRTFSQFSERFRFWVTYQRPPSPVLLRNLQWELDCLFGDGTDFDSLSLAQLMDLLTEIKEGNDHWIQRSLDYSSLTWFTQLRIQDKPFKDFISIYKEWVICNSFFVIKNKFINSDNDLTNEPYTKRSEQILESVNTLGESAVYHSVDSSRNVVKSNFPRSDSIVSVAKINGFKPFSFIILCIMSITLLSSLLTYIDNISSSVVEIIPKDIYILGIESQEDLFRVSGFHVSTWDPNLGALVTMVAIIIASALFSLWLAYEKGCQDALSQKDLTISRLFRACDELRISDYEKDQLIKALEHHQMEQDLRIGVLDYTSRKLEDILISLGEPYEHVLHRFKDLESLAENVPSSLT